MRSLILAALAGLILLSQPATGQFDRSRYRDFYQQFQRAYSSSPVQLVSSWYQRFLGRVPDPQGLANWVAALRQGNSPEMVLAPILGSQEYWDRAGGSPQGFITNLFRDIAGRNPNPAEFNHFMRRMRTQSRIDLAYALLTRYPMSWQMPTTTFPPPEPSWDYRRPFDFRFRR
jgi:hypothetical protein